MHLENKNMLRSFLRLKTEKTKYIQKFPSVLKKTCTFYFCLDVSVYLDAPLDDKEELYEWVKYISFHLFGDSPEKYLFRSGV